jgi:hypothetical protein
MHRKDDAAFLAFKTSAAKLHEAGKIGEARRKIIGARIDAPELRTAVALIDSWLADQPHDVRSYALAKPQPRRVLA